VSHGDIITALLEGIVERKTSTEKYHALHPDPASLSIIKIEESLPSSYTIITGRCLRITDGATWRAGKIRGNSS
jgi:hypothetical protein